MFPGAVIIVLLILVISVFNNLFWTPPPHMQEGFAGVCSDTHTSYGEFKDIIDSQDIPHESYRFEGEDCLSWAWDYTDRIAAVQCELAVENRPGWSYKEQAQLQIALQDANVQYQVRGRCDGKEYLVWSDEDDSTAEQIISELGLPSIEEVY